MDASLTLNTIMFLLSIPSVLESPCTLFMVSLIERTTHMRHTFRTIASFDIFVTNGEHQVAM